MTRKKAAPTVNPAIEAALNKLLKDVLKDPEASLTDKMKVLDRSLKWEAIKMKAESDDWGSGFLSDEEELMTQRADDGTDDE